MNQPQQNGVATIDIGRGLLMLCQVIVEKGIQPAVGNVPLWSQCGLGEVTREFLREHGVPMEPVPVVDVARYLGILRTIR